MTPDLDKVFPPGSETAKAIDNFPVSLSRWSRTFFEALATVKLACLRVNHDLGYIDNDRFEALEAVLDEMRGGRYFEYFVTDPHQGGAGTSVNMNINEIASFFASERTGANAGIDPYEHVNLHQSTNDVFPTAVRIAMLTYLPKLENALNSLVCSLQNKETEFAHVVKIGRTELTAAVACTLGMEFGAYAQAISRDRWRIYKASERVRQVNLGGTAIGTGISAPRQYILAVSTRLREITGFPVSRSENLFDSTMNHDDLSEAFSMIKVVAINLEKIASDLRLMHLLGEIVLPAMQTGSTVMPGKVNPVIPEMVSSVAKKVLSSETLINRCLSAGELELNAFLPLAAHTIFEDLELLIQAVSLFEKKCVKGIKAHTDMCLTNLLNSPSAATVLVFRYGYNSARKVADFMTANSVNIYEAVNSTGISSVAEVESLLSPKSVLALGSRYEQ